MPHTEHIALLNPPPRDIQLLSQPKELSKPMPWYLVQTKPNAHALAERNLRRQGIETFLPMQERTERKSSRFVSQSRPLFPGYLFIKVAEGEAPWRSVNGTLGVSRLVSFGATPRPVPEGLVSSLQARCDATGHLRPFSAFAAGDDVEVLQGPFAQFAATVEKIDPEKRVWVLLDLMGQKMRVSLEAGHIAKI